MWRLLWLLLGVALVLGLFLRGRAPSTPTLPPLTLLDLEGRPVDLRGLKGQPLVLNVWATWCPPCQRELPLLLRAEATHTRIRFRFASQGEDGRTVRAYLVARGFPEGPFLLDPEAKVSQAFGLAGIPATLFFDREGRLLARHLGEITEPLLEGYLRVLSD